MAGHLGFNPMRLRWKLIRWQEQRRRRARQREQVLTHITYAHKTCRECGAVQDRNEAVCTRCGAKLGSRGFQVLERMGLLAPVPLSMSTLLAAVILVAYGRVWLAGGGGLHSPTGALLVDFGGRWPPLIADEPWRLVTATLLHGGLLHLVFNLLAIASVGPRIEELYGRATMLGLFIVTGVLANLGALEVGRLAVGIGASGGIMGLVGAAAGCGQRMGTTRGRELRDAMLKWAGYTFVFGFAVGADNWAHLFGGVAGAAFGLAVSPETWQRRAWLWLRALTGAVGVLATLGALAILLTRAPSPPPDPDPDADADAVIDGRAVLDGYVEICTRLYAGDAPGAVAAANRIVGPLEPPGPPLTADAAAEMCEWMQQRRDACRIAEDRAGSAADADDRALCREFLPIFDRLPPRPVHPAAPAGAGSGSAGSGSAQ